MSSQQICILQRCKRPSLADSKARGLCILHAPVLRKHLEEFQSAVQDLIRQAQVSGLCDFSQCHFPEGYEASWLEEAFHYKCRFARATFESWAVFADMTIKGEVFFHGVTFKGGVSFDGVVFERGAWFMDATFGSRSEGASTWASFAQATFRGEACFDRAIFLSKSSFLKTAFYEKASFTGAIFEQDVHFEEVIFRKDANFQGAAFWDQALFDKLAIKGSFGGLVASKPELVKFVHVDLSRCSFLHTDVSRLDFINVAWDRQRYRRFRPRTALYDERRLEQAPEDFPHVIKLYHQLVANFERSRQYELAGDFHYGAMELRRKQLSLAAQEKLKRIPGLGRVWGWLRRNVFSLLAWYHHLSGYGERPGQALTIWAGLLLAMAVAVMAFGFPGPISGRPIDYDWTGNPKDLLDPQLWKDFAEALLYSFRASTFRAETGPGVSPATAWAVTLASIFGPLQLALFALALRRRFRR